MKLIVVLKPYLYLFFLLGLSPYPYQIESDGKYLKLYFLQKTIKQIPLLFGVFSNLFQYVWILLSYKDVFSVYGNINLMMALAFVSAIVILNFTSFIQTICYRNTFASIISQLEKIELLIQLSFGQTIDLHMNILLKQFFKKFLLILLLFFIVVFNTIQFMPMANQNEINVNICLYITQLTSLMIILQIVLFMDLIRMLMIKIGDILKCDLDIVSFALKRNNSKSVDMLRIVKIFYMDLYGLVELIKKYFGWSLVCLLVKYFFDITYDVYWLWLISNKTQIEIIRKKFHLVFFSINLVKF